MNIEIERKFLINDMDFKEKAIASHLLAQGYIARSNGRTVRVRIEDGKGILTIKGASANGLSRLEWEKEIGEAEARELMVLCISGIVEKTRYIVPAAFPEGRFFEVDVFHGDNEGLVVAEIELGSEDEDFERPEWLGEEVTGESRYYNSNLSVRPYKTWQH